jgi:hypothetical protein
MTDLSDRRYYAERAGAIDPSNDIEMLRYFFFDIYEKYKEDISFYYSYNADIYVAGKTKMDIWPIEDNIRYYDEVKLFTVMELIYDHITDIGIEDTIIKKKAYRSQINTILKNYNGEYELSKDGEILKISPPGFKTLIEEAVETNDLENIDSRVKYAISKFSRYSSSVEEKKDAVRTLGDVLEYLGKFGIKLDNKDDSDLFKIINGFDIRHHNREQQSGYDKDIWYDWIFYTFLASIHVLLKLNDKKFDLKIQHTD